jgi:hypothetical protein
VSIFFIGLAVVLVLIFLTNTKRWKAIGGGLKKSKRDLKDELEELRAPTDEA